MKAGEAATVAGCSAGDRPSSLAMLNTISHAVLAVGAGNDIKFANQAAESLLAVSAAGLEGRQLADFIPADNPVFYALEQARRTGASVAESEVVLEGKKFGPNLVAVNADPVVDEDGCVVITLHERSLARRIDRQLAHRSAARSVSAMAAMLAHEVKNPLSGIRGSAQLLGQRVSRDDRELTDLICRETDRIVAMVNRMEVFSGPPNLSPAAVNIHEVLDHVRRLAESGFARHVRFAEHYDPSLPAVAGDHDQLVQVFLNLVKNAAEAVKDKGGEVSLGTRYEHGLHVLAPGGDRRLGLPLVVSIGDNGPGISDDVRRQLFEPFVTTKAKGTGLGLALVARIVSNHGGIVDVTSRPRRTRFNVMLPAYTEPPEVS